jgi:PKD repeat protein
VNVETNCSGSADVVVVDDRIMPDASYGYTAADLAVSFAANFAGGTGYLWNFGDGATSDVANPNHEFAVGGTYHVCLTVTNECGDVQSCKDILVENGASAILVELTIENISCHAAADGALSVLAFGGSGTYTFEWVGPGGFESNGASIHNLGPGSYLVTVADDQGNATQVQATIVEPPALVTTTQLIPQGGPNGPGIDLSVDGGTQGYTYLWSNGALTQDLHLVRTGTYQCTITDANGCQSITEPIRIVNLKDMTIRPPGEIVHVIGNPAIDPLTVIIDSDSDALHAVRVFDVLGRPHIMERWTGTSGVVDMRQLIPGVYFLAVFENERLLETVRLALND